MALYFYRNLLTNALVYSDQSAPPEGNRNMELIGEQTNMSPTNPTNWVYHRLRSTFASVEKDDRVSGKISGLTRMYGMFDNCSSLTSIDLSGFDTSKVTSMGSMFNGCSSLASIDLSSFDTSKVTNMSYMFNGCSSLASIDLSGFDTSQVTNMYIMFYRCSSLTSLDLSSFDTSKVTEMSNMFSGCSSLASLDLSGFDTSKGPNMYNLFSNCSSLTSIDLSGFDTSKVTSMNNMFNGCSNLRILAISGSMSNALSRLPASQYYPASGGDPVARENLTAGTWVRDEADLSLMSTIVQQAQMAMSLRRQISSLSQRVVNLESLIAEQ